MCKRKLKSVRFFFTAGLYLQSIWNCLKLHFMNGRQDNLSSALRFSSFHLDLGLIICISVNRRCTWKTARLLWGTAAEKLQWWMCIIHWETDMIWFTCKGSSATLNINVAILYNMPEKNWFPMCCCVLHELKVFLSQGDCYICCSNLISKTWTINS